MSNPTSPTLTCSLVSEDSPSQRDGRDSGLSASAKSTRSVRKSSPLGSGLLPTPATRDYKGANGPEHMKAGERSHMGQLPNALRFSPTSEPSTAHGSGESPCLPGDSLANLSALPGSERARTMTVTSGRKCSELYTKQSPVGSLVRTLLASSTWHSTKCVLTWRAKVTKSNRLLFQLAPSTPRTGGIGSGLLHTASWQDPGVNVGRLVTKEGEPAKIGERVYDRKTGRLAQVGLHQQIAMLPTPQNRDYRSPDKPESERFKNKQEKGWTIDLNSIVPMIQVGEQGPNQTLPLNRTGGLSHGTSRGLKLQPIFCEWMMGYPSGWTNISKE
jgi:hypothetical protein